MRPICWLHISDIHLRSDNEWSQDVVLKTMCRNIREQREAGMVADFILVTGDVAFSGKSEEYDLAEKFFNELQAASGMSKKRIFCVAGNHDIDRDRQKLCFQGGRVMLRATSQVDSLLAGGEDLDTLLLRQENYRQFQRSYFSDQKRAQTLDGLSYVSRLEVNETQVAIVGLDSAWLAEGGMDDHGKLLIGERQVINAIELAYEGEASPNIIVGMAHHPLHLLQDLDRQPVQSRIEREFHFLHCGHLHEPETRITGIVGSGCLTIATGTSFETRQSHHAYSMIKLDLLQGNRNVSVFRYNPRNGTYSPESSDDYAIELTPAGRCGVDELAMAIQSYCPAIAPWAHYLSALVLGQKSEFLIPFQNSYTFGSVDVFTCLPDSALKRKTSNFLTFRNVLRVLLNRKPLPKILARYGDSIREYGEALTVACNNDSALRKRLEYYDEDFRLFSASAPQQAFSHTLGLLSELANTGEWGRLREKAESLLSIGDELVVNRAKRILALALANSDEPQDKEKAIKYYRSLVESETVNFNDIGNLAILLMEVGRMDDASSTILEGIKTFPDKSNYFSEIGQQIVEATGNRDLRRQIENAMRG